MPRPLLFKKLPGPELLSFALESGALTQSSGGKYIHDKRKSGRYCLHSSWNGSGVLRTMRPNARSTGSDKRFCTLSVDQQSTTTTSSTTPANSSSPPPGTAVTVPSSVGKLTGVTAKFRILNKFDPRSPSFRDNWNAAVKADTSYITLAQTLMQSNGNISRAVFLAEDSGLEAEWEALTLTS